MTPKEKANELFKKMAEFQEYYQCDGDLWAKECALIVVNEFLNFQENLIITEGSLSYQYWQEVKQEINKIVTYERKIHTNKQ